MQLNNTNFQNKGDCMTSTACSLYIPRHEVSVRWSTTSIKNRHHITNRTAARVGVYVFIDSLMLTPRVR